MLSHCSIPPGPICNLLGPSLQLLQELHFQLLSDWTHKWSLPGSVFPNSLPCFIISRSVGSPKLYTESLVFSRNAYFWASSCVDCFDLVWVHKSTIYSFPLFLCFSFYLFIFCFLGLLLVLCSETTPGRHGGPYRTPGFEPSFVPN